MPEGTRALDWETLQGVSILVGTTGRMKHFVGEGIVSLEEVRYVILDEADRMLDMGFAGDIEALLSDPKIPPKEERSTLMVCNLCPPSLGGVSVQCHL